ncbi:MAG: choice-of-anchor D domain-containing protein [Lewinellaceae bacterium]|nr:choice-of-anchor D domain-containing protein [Lewinellaceae bacterium]
MNRGGGGGGGYTGGKGSASKQGVGFGGSNYINETHGSWVSTASNIGDGATGGGTNKDGAVTMTGGTGDCCGALRGMLISGNNQNIDDDDTTPALVDHTEFETALLGCQTVVRTFTIKNVGTVPLPVTAINITGAQASDFTVGGISLPTTLARHTSKTFTVTFNPSGGGLRTATIEINYDVCIDVFDFAIQGTGTGADMDVTGAGQSIADGDNSPALVDDTDFGDVPTNSNAVHNFTIKNLGISDLTIPVSAFVFMGPDPTKFSVGGIALPATISAGNMVNFTVTYTPGGTGMHTATLKIDNNDCNENPYNFDLKGNGFMPVPPKISVKGNGNTINNRAITVSTADDTDFGAVAVAGGMVTHTFTIENILNGLPLKLDGLPLIEIAGRDQTDFSVTQSTVNTLGSGGSTTFEVKFDPSAPGVRSAVIVITHNDLPENPFVFRVQGVGN